MPTYSTFHICYSLYYDPVCHRNLMNEYLYIPTGGSGNTQGFASSGAKCQLTGQACGDGHPNCCLGSMCMGKKGQKFCYDSHEVYRPKGLVG